MISELESLQTQLIGEGFLNTNISFGQTISSDLTAADVANGRIVLWFPLLDTDQEMMTWQGSPLVYLKGSISSYASSDKASVALSHSLLVNLGFKRENGDVGRPPRMPIDYALGIIKILWIQCPGGVRSVATQAGNIWVVEQPVEMAFYTP